LALTRDVVPVARPARVSVEAEVGTIGTTAEYGAEIENPHLADPAAAMVPGCATRATLAHEASIDASMLLMFAAKLLPRMTRSLSS
jgi:fructose/tagatose bisphosphate aldolase